MMIAQKNIVMEKTKPQRNRYHGIITVEINFPITSAPKDNVPTFIRILLIFSNCFVVNCMIFILPWNKKRVNTIFVTIQVHSSRVHGSRLEGDEN